MSQVINDYQLMKISSFIDGELEINEIKDFFVRWIKIQI